MNPPMTLSELASELVGELYHQFGNVGQPEPPEIMVGTGELLQHLLRILPDTLGLHHSVEPLRCTACLTTTNGYSMLLCPKCFHNHVSNIPKVEAELARMGKQALLDHIMTLQAMVEQQSGEVVALRGIIDYAGIEHNV